MIRGEAETGRLLCCVVAYFGGFVCERLIRRVGGGRMSYGLIGVESTAEMTFERHAPA